MVYDWDDLGVPPILRNHQLKDYLWKSLRYVLHLLSQRLEDGQDQFVRTNLQDIYSIFDVFLRDKPNKQFKEGKNLAFPFPWQKVCPKESLV